MGYFKTLMIDPSAAREYSQRWANYKPVVAAPVALSAPVNITREHVGKALQIMRQNVRHNAPLLNALNRSALNVEACPWTFNTDGELVITSATNGHTRYHVTANSCDCKAARAGRPCWHRQAYALLYAADAWRRLYASQEPAQRAAWREAQQAVDELY
jgi:hypothetical protein